MSEPMQHGEHLHHNGYRSFFWPVVLIGVGVIWLLVNLNILTTSSIALLVRFWPVLLILIGIDIIFARRYALVGALLGLITVGLIIFAAFFAPQFNLGDGASILGIPVRVYDSSQVKTAQYSEPIGQAKVASIRMNLSQGHTVVKALASSTNLIEANVKYIGDFTFLVQGQESKTVTLGQTGRNLVTWFAPVRADDLRWDIGLNPQVPINLTVKSASGFSEFDLRQLELSSVDFEGASGASVLQLPASERRMPVNINTASGSFSLDMPAHSLATLNFESASGSVNCAIGEGSDITMVWEGASGSQNLEIGKDSLIDANIDTASGSVTIKVPSNAAIRVEVLDAGSGSISVPSWTKRLQGQGKEGIWESDSYAAAQKRITLRLHTGSGSVTIN